jgi:hypothetical protein
VYVLGMRQFSAVPTGLAIRFATVPGTEVPGYLHVVSTERPPCVFAASLDSQLGEANLAV